jgi:hypothetical protein
MIIDPASYSNLDLLSYDVLQDAESIVADVTVNGWMKCCWTLDPTPAAAK